MPKARPLPSVYLAGPEVFLRKPKAAGAIRAEICARHGLWGRFPLDAQVDLKGLPLAERALAIYRANEGLMLACDAVIANLTPFRGTGMDAGTAYEVGFMRALGKPVFGYTNSHLSYFERVAKFDPKPFKRRRGAEETMAFEDSDAMGVEQFALAENLMIIGAIHDSGGTVTQSKTRRRERYTDLAAFEACVAQAAKVLLA
jgi:nucleoside 2-deoxyribosyltransferase